MHIIYVSSLCTKDTFNKLFCDSLIKPGQQAQKYHRLIAEGFVKNGVDVTTISALPVTAKNCSKKIVVMDDELESGVHYTYLPIFNLRLLKNLFVAIGSFLCTILSFIRFKESIVVCDVLNISVTSGALWASKLMGKKSIGIVTDIPSMITNNPNGLNVKVNNYIIKNYSSYVFLTDQMNELINKENKPYVVIEGQVDINMKEVENNIEEKYPNKVCLYAGMLQKKYGIKRLVDAFIMANIEDAELHLFGSGDYESELKEICERYENVKYFGVVSNDEVVKAELKATLLINPRPSNEEFTKYSFPSKNMEYMVSGTPVLTTKLPGMPEEYCEYVYLFREENVEAISEKLKYVLSKSNEELHKKGHDAKSFVLNYKSNIVQTKKIIHMIDGGK